MLSEYPHSNNHELNLDWLLDKVQELENKIKELEDKIDELNIP